MSNPPNRDPPYGQSVVSWRTIDQELRPDIGPEPEFSDLAADMNRLRGLIMAQCGETEAVLGLILAAVAATIDPERKTAGQLVRCVRQKLPHEISTRWQVELDEIEVAIQLRNQAVHSDVHIGSTWVEYQTGGGHHEPVIMQRVESAQLGGRPAYGELEGCASWRAVRRCAACTVGRTATPPVVGGRPHS